ncbi:MULTISPECIES: pre-peptidase C-terminal domain-containing protein [unclassified Microcoleus]|uniref:pre-peptidase C-terminal domain-containing protein n=1 Tax=unclassified Microcoleus TaxID=2642155 RepID=UPI001DAD84B1|nr:MULTISPECIES: pre-peptidase C-terminal domain-containing protein [unclassified Microcoleus]MCC3444600.1 PPC domain-containing protein [Microcoleus sp. PH2017_03_ELD_O_A]MCC3467942.1 PPC domain-containing protein [Microcoleus sp. PH2017_06_SFM_O_A]TAE64399.1 MAG: peptidase [Oscillatoriales cyanobacterium]MCC3412164.1 PPC domain-containing protein [Microcoleus sp. PH2017_02_FOX_O_A]MCC3446310.1 PPC domain-containing protein [Microcoleus sp. PH2017_09_SFU_O_A]
MGQIRFWAIAPIALLAIFSGKPTLSVPVSNPGEVTNSSSPIVSAEFPQNSHNASQAGKAVLAQASPSPSPSGLPTPKASPTQTPTVQPSPSPDGRSSKIILEQKGELTTSKSSVLPSDSSLYDEYTFEGTQGQKVVVNVESSEFDTYLAVLNSQGELLGENDDVTQQNSNSELTVTLSASGRYRVVVNAYDPPPKGKGKYSLIIREVTGN